MESIEKPQKKRITVGILIGLLMLILSAGVVSAAYLMVSVLVMGCVKSPPEWIYMIVFAGFPMPLLIASITVPYLYIQKQRVIWMIFTPIAALSMSCLLFLIWFLILTQYC